MRENEYLRYLDPPWVFRRGKEPFLWLESTKMSTCKQCLLQVIWEVVDSKWQCFNPDGSVHWNLCSKHKFARIKTTGQLVMYDKDIAYLTNLKKSGIQYVEQHSGIVRGSNYNPSGECMDCVPPWEVCAACPDGMR